MLTEKYQTLFDQFLTKTEPSNPDRVLKISQDQDDKAYRYNNDKPRYDLLEPYAINELVKVFSAGARKYEDRNWEKGMKWSKMLASLKRHIAAFEKGEDYDPELGTHHMANAAWNALGLVTYSRTHPELDDRPHAYLHRPKIGLDLDDVLVNWCSDWGKKHGLPVEPSCWNFSYENANRFAVDKEELEDFYSKLTPKINPKDLPFEPVAYVTARSIDINITKKWIENNGFPTVPVYTVPFGASKVEAVKASGAEWFIDDCYHNFVELNKAGICCFLYDAPHNARYDVGYRRVLNFKDFKERFL